MGNPQDIQCGVSSVGGMDSSLVLISWMGPGGNVTINNSRVTISPTTSSGNSYTSSIQLVFLLNGRR